MESNTQVKTVRFISAMTALFFLLGSCHSSPIIVDPLVLHELSPLPKAIVAARQAATDFEPVYATFRIVEVAEVNGIQRSFLVRTGANKTGIKIGATGEMAEDEAFQRVIGTYRISEVFSDFFRGEVTELTHRIGTTAYARIQTGERLKTP